MPHFVLTYELAPDYLERRAALRAEHLRLAWRASERGDLVLGGPVGDPPEWALLMFESDSADVAEAFARSDPYVTNGLVTAWTVQPWNTVVGNEAADPVRL